MLGFRLAMVEPNGSARDRLIVALDVSSAGEALRLASQLKSSVSRLKVGKQLFTAEGPQVVRDLTSSGFGIFLDLKFHDIPNTVGAAVRSAAGLGVDMLTVHAAGGSKMLRAAVEAARQASKPPKILAVTVLTSMSDEDVQEVGFGGRVVDEVLRLAELALTAGCDGIVTSAREAAEVRRRLGDGFAVVTPGIRPAGDAAGDQARVVTPTDAVRAGVSYLVVGRPITAAADPGAAARRIVNEIEAAALAIH
jgi:orotidine-5'-phosphate decarboxylase